MFVFYPQSDRILLAMSCLTEPELLIGLAGSLHFAEITSSSICLKFNLFSHSYTPTCNSSAHICTHTK